MSRAWPGQSGTRLELLQFQSSTGYVGPDQGVLYDTQLEVSCQVGLASDGNYRCLPVAIDGTSLENASLKVYEDSACSVPMVYTTTPVAPFASNGPTQTRYIRDQVTGRFYKVPANSLTGHKVYYMAGPACVSDSTCTLCVVTAANENPAVADSSFAKVDLVQVP